MIILWSVKGGVGCTLAACVLALRPLAAPATLVDLAGDAPAMLGFGTPSGPGVSEWLQSPTATCADLARLAVPVTDDLQLLPRGAAAMPTDAWDRLATALGSLPGVVVDIGHHEPPEVLARAASSSLLVTRNCYVALQHAARAQRAPSGVVLVREHGRTIDRAGVEAVTGARVIVEIPYDPAIGRAVDSGLLRARLPRVLTAPLARVA